MCGFDVERGAEAVKRCERGVDFHDRDRSIAEPAGRFGQQLLRPGHLIRSTPIPPQRNGRAGLSDDLDIVIYRERESGLGHRCICLQDDGGVRRR